MATLCLCLCIRQAIHSARVSHAPAFLLKLCALYILRLSEYGILNRMLKVVRTLDAYLLSSVNVNLTKSFCILSTNELLKRRQGNNNNKRLKSKPKFEGKESEPKKHQKRIHRVGIVCGQSWKLHKLPTEQLKQ